MPKKYRVASAGVVGLVLGGLVALPAQAAEDDPYTLRIDPTVQGERLGTLSDTLTSWTYTEDWTTAAQGQPSDYFATNYPEITTVDLFGATGGGYTSNAEVIGYYVDTPTGASIEALFQTSEEPAANLKFWVATDDPESFAQITQLSTQDTPVAAGAWTRRTYTIPEFPAGTTIFRVAFPTGGLNAYNPQLSRVEIDGADPIVDELDDWSHVGQRSSGLEFDTANGGLFGDESRVMRTVNDRFTAAESIIYESAAMTGASARVLFTGDEPMDDVRFFTSPDGEAWAQQTGWTATDQPAGSWTAREYSLTGLPAGSNQLKVEFPTGGANSWNPQIGEVTVLGPNGFTDPLVDWSVAEYHTSGLAFDTQNASVFGDDSRAQRTNNYDGFPDVVVTRDLFVNPQDRNTLDDYDFEPLLVALRNVHAQGLTPKVRLANVPIKFTSEPEIGAFRTNVAPPDDYEAYRAYLVALLTTIVDEFGIDEARSWIWGLTPEIENASWFLADDGTAASTKAEFFTLYDYSVDALERVLGSEHVRVGAHMMPQSQGIWNPLEFLDHVASGTNAATGATGAQLDYLDFSFYEGGQGNTGQLETTAAGALGIAASVNLIRDHAISVGLTDLEYDIPENGIAFDQEGRFILNNILGTGYEASLDALIFKRLNDLDIRAWSRWALNTERVWGGIPGVSSHLNALAARMEGDVRLGVTRLGELSDPTSIVDAVVGYDDEEGALHALAFNHNPSPTATTDEPVTLEIANVAPLTGDSVNVRTYLVDDEHASFWTQWWADRTAHGVSNQTANNFSPLSLTVPQLMTVESDKTFWYSKEDEYRALAELTSTTEDVPVVDGTVSLDASLAQHGVVFYEITNVDTAAQPVTTERSIHDDLDNWYFVNSHTNGLGFDTLNGQILEDTSRARRNDTSEQSIDYWLLEARSASVTAMFATDTEPLADLAFFVSEDGREWDEVDPVSHEDTPLNAGLWTKRVYTLDDFPAGTDYVRVVIPAGGANWWNPQVSQVTVSSSAIDAPPTTPPTGNPPAGGGAGDGGAPIAGSGDGTVAGAAATGLADTGLEVSWLLFTFAGLLTIGGLAVALRERRRRA